MQTENKPTIKELLFEAIGRLVAELPCKSVTLIVCCEAPINAFLGYVGQNNPKGAILHINAKPELIEQIMATAWDAASHGNNGRQSNP